VAVEERAELLVLAQKPLVHRLRGERGGERQVTAGNSLGQAHQVGRHSLVLGGEHSSGAPEPSGHLVEDEQRLVAIAQLAYRTQVALGMDQHARGALHQGLHDHGRQLAAVPDQQTLEGCRVPGLGLERLEQERVVDRVEQVDPAHRHRPESVTW
jgi:hypothetical protein